MNKIVNIGTQGYGQIFCKITINDGKLSITGVEGPLRNGDCKGSCGQINMDLKAENIEPAVGWSTELIDKFLQTWDRWHLNDMRPGCEHMRERYSSKKVEVVELIWGDLYYKMRRSASDGKLNAEEYAAFQSMQAVVNRDGNKKFIDDNIQLAIDAGILKVHKTEEKSIGWLRYDEHPEGLLGKPCPVCGDKYGTAWKREELPADVIAFLESLPETTIEPTWI